MLQSQQFQELKLKASLYLPQQTERKQDMNNWFFSRRTLVQIFQQIQSQSWTSPVRRPIPYKLDRNYICDRMNFVELMLVIQCPLTGPRSPAPRGIVPSRQIRYIYLTAQSFSLHKFIIQMEDELFSKICLIVSCIATPPSVMTRLIKPNLPFSANLLRQQETTSVPSEKPTRLMNRSGNTLWMTSAKQSPTLAALWCASVKGLFLTQFSMLTPKLRTLRRIPLAPVRLIGFRATFIAFDPMYAPIYFTVLLFHPSAQSYVFSKARINPSHSKSLEVSQERKPLIAMVTVLD